ncbi:MAG: glycosyltransferase family 2 protein [Chitinophagales bacterium]|nr:glycosyltransferase family 2 protein [Bacteroidota bacterium]MCB9043135.1 glycosyltransferase family 2 protein [Chitinophagales bacterium]
MNYSPLVSVVLTSYNHLALLQRSFQCLLEQEYTNIEIVIVDDGSTDGSREWITQIATQYPQKVNFFLQAQNVGVSANKSKGFQLAKGELITYLDGDDLYYSNKIKDEVAVFAQNPTVDVVYSNFVFCDEQGNVFRQWAKDAEKMPQGFILKEIITRAFPYNTLFRFELMKRQVIEKIQYYRHELSAYEDWDGRIRYADFAQIAYSGTVGAAYTFNPQGISKTMRRKQLLTIQEAVFNDNFLLCKKHYSPQECNAMYTMMAQKFSRANLKLDTQKLSTKRLAKVWQHWRQFPHDWKVFYSFFV